MSHSQWHASRIQFEYRESATGASQLIKLYPSLHPLLDWHFETNRVNLFVREPGDELIDLNNPEQKVLTEILEINIERIERNTKGMYVFYPFVEKRSRQEPKIIMINPAISFGLHSCNCFSIPRTGFHTRLG
jgi:hypothetical protein